MYEATLKGEIEYSELGKSVEPFQTLADLKLALIGGGTGAVNLE